MDLTLIALGALATVILAASGNQAAHEFRAWAPWIIERLIRCAVVRLPETARERYEEEWSSHVSELPGDIGKLIAALGFLRASKRMRPDLQTEEVQRPPAGGRRTFQLGSKTGSVRIELRVRPSSENVSLFAADYRTDRNEAAHTHLK